MGVVSSSEVSNHLNDGEESSSNPLETKTELIDQIDIMTYYDPVVPIRNRQNFDINEFFYPEPSASVFPQTGVRYAQSAAGPLYDPVEPIRNRPNFIKYVFFYLEPCASAFLQAYRWLYDRAGPPEHIIDHYNSFSGTAKERNKMFNFDKGDITKLKEMKMNPDEIKNSDVSLLYKLIQYGTGNNKLASLNVWSKKCPSGKQDKLEHLLFLVKEGRNDVAHRKNYLKNLTDKDVADECTKLIGRLSSIVQQSGEMAKIDQSHIDEVKKGLKKDLEEIRDEKAGQLTSDILPF